MFDIAWSELALIGAVALVVIGPKDLPKVMRTMGQWTRKARLLAGEFQHNVEDMIRQAELDEVRRQVQAVNPTAVKAKVETMIDAKAIADAVSIDPRPGALSQPQPVPAPDPAGAAAAAEVPVLPETVLSETALASQPASGNPSPAAAVTPVSQPDKPAGPQT